MIAIFDLLNCRANAQLTPGREARRFCFKKNLYLASARKALG